MDAHYFVTKNRISPFVCVLGDWSAAGNSSLIRSVRAGVVKGHLLEKKLKTYQIKTLLNGFLNPGMNMLDAIACEACYGE